MYFISGSTKGIFALYTGRITNINIQTIIAQLGGRVNAQEYQIKELKFMEDVHLKGPWISFSSSAQL